MGSLTTYSQVYFRITLHGIMKVFILLAVLAFAYGERIKGSFEVPDYAAFKAKWNKSYTAEQHDAHMAAYLKNVEFINNHNAEYDQGKHTYWCGINEWSDLTDAEYEARNGYRLPEEPITGPVRNGIFDDASCGTSINHAVACVGYDTNQNYWIVRNSWGTSWGESGYIRMVKGKNMCGMLSNSCYPSM